MITGSLLIERLCSSHAKLPDHITCRVCKSFQSLLPTYNHIHTTCTPLHRDGGIIVSAVGDELTSLDTIRCHFGLANRIILRVPNTDLKWLSVPVALLFPAFLHLAAQSWDSGTSISIVELLDSILLRAWSCLQTLALQRSQLSTLPQQRNQPALRYSVDPTCARLHDVCRGRQAG